MRTLFGGRRTFECGRGIARVGRVPRSVAPSERRCRHAVQEDRQGDRQEDGVQQQRLVREVGILDEDHRKDDRREATRPEPAEEGDRRSPGAGAQHRQTHGNHANERQAEKRIQDDLGGDVVEHGHEHDGAEEDERDCSEQAARLLEQERHLASDLSTEAAEDGASDERGDEPAAAHPHGQAVGERSPRHRYDLNPELIDEAAWDAHPDHGCGREPRNHAAEGIRTRSPRARAPLPRRLRSRPRAPRRSQSRSGGAARRCRR